ncbi:MAG TPA: succinate dehydrogenase, cytochrome b556 subunit [Stellaceae bacterium]|nr:succinate dehydrogenase, cytochrome b556 subunit [Stellaceae bacterium]
MTPVERPLSPHLLIYKPQLTSLLSVTHRGTGFALGFGMVPLLWWLVAASWSDGAYALVQSFWGSWFGQLCFFGWAFSVFYHLLNGIRHLSWDAGLGFELKTLYRTGWTVITASVVLTIAAYIAAYHLRGLL